MRDWLDVGLHRSIVSARLCARSIFEKLGTKRRWIPGREDDWQTCCRPDGTPRLSNRCVTLVPTIRAENPKPIGTRSAMYRPDWIDPELGESIEEATNRKLFVRVCFDVAAFALAAAHSGPPAPFSAGPSPPRYRPATMPASGLPRQDEMEVLNVPETRIRIAEDFRMTAPLTFDFSDDVPTAQA